MVSIASYHFVTNLYFIYGDGPNANTSSGLFEEASLESNLAVPFNPSFVFLIIHPSFGVPERNDETSGVTSNSSHCPAMPFLTRTEAVGVDTKLLYQFFILINSKGESHDVEITFDPERS